MPKIEKERDIMYLHICKDTIIKNEDIIGIFKLSAINKEIIENLGENLIDKSENDEKTFILTNDKGYISNISVETLEKRAKSIV